MDNNLCDILTEIEPNQERRQKLVDIFNEHSILQLDDLYHLESDELKILIPPIGARARFLSIKRRLQANESLSNAHVNSSAGDITQITSISLTPPLTPIDNESVEISLPLIVSSSDRQGASSERQEEQQQPLQGAVSAPICQAGEPRSQSSSRSSHPVASITGRYSQSDVDIYHLFCVNTKLMSVVTRNTKELKDADVTFLESDKLTITRIVVNDMLNDWKENCTDETKYLYPPVIYKQNAAKAIVNLFTIYKQIFTPNPESGWFSQSGGATGAIQTRLRSIRANFRKHNAENIAPTQSSRPTTTTSRAAKKRRPGTTIKLPDAKRPRLATECIPNDLIESQNSNKDPTKFTYFLSLYRKYLVDEPLTLLQTTESMLYFDAIYYYDGTLLQQLCRLKMLNKGYQIDDWPTKLNLLCEKVQCLDDFKNNWIGVKNTHGELFAVLSFCANYFENSPKGQLNDHLIRLLPTSVDPFNLSDIDFAHMNPQMVRLEAAKGIKLDNSLVISLLPDIELFLTLFGTFYLFDLRFPNNLLKFYGFMENLLMNGKSTVKIKMFKALLKLDT